MFGVWKSWEVVGVFQFIGCCMDYYGILWHFIILYMEVSINGGTTKLSILMGLSITNHAFLGYPHFWKPPYHDRKIGHHWNIWKTGFKWGHGHYLARGGPRFSCSWWIRSIFSPSHMHQTIDKSWPLCTDTHSIYYVYRTHKTATSSPQHYGLKAPRTAAGNVLRAKEEGSNHGWYTNMNSVKHVKSYPYI